jgi:ADP-ribose pyrophosphatase YjhB (NUDIX family)
LPQKAFTDVIQFPPARAICVMDKRFCCYCGSPTEMRIPEGDHLPRRICPACAAVHYENPRIVVGCVPEADDGRILICLRAIEPRRGWWTVPAGFMENGETLRAGAARECMEEALAQVEVGALLAVVDIPEAHQVHVFFRAQLTTSAFGAGPESLDAKLVDYRQIPWEELAFPSTRFALESFLRDRESGTALPHQTTLARRYPG